MLLTNKICEDAFVGVHVNLLQPLRQAVKTRLTANVVDKDQSVCRTIVTLRYRAKALLARCVPYLQLQRQQLHATIVQVCNEKTGHQISS